MTNRRTTYICSVRPKTDPIQRPSWRYGPPVRFPMWTWFMLTLFQEALCAVDRVLLSISFSQSSSRVVCAMNDVESQGLGFGRCHWRSRHF